jgi:hypothetical protein
MLYKKNKKEKEFDNSTYSSIKKEMAKPRMSKSAKIAEQHLVARRILQRRVIVAHLMNRSVK